MSPYLCAYVASYLVATAVALTAAWRQLFSAERRRLLREPWRLLTFVLGTAVVAGAAPYSGDPTWDVPDSLLTAALVYVLAPWCVGVMRRERSLRGLAPAIVLFFVPCWAYDLYILFDRGFYPDSWDSNLALSGIVTLCGGLFWNLSWAPGTPKLRTVGIMALVSLPVLLMITAFVIQAGGHGGTAVPLSAARTSPVPLTAGASGATGAIAAPHPAAQATNAALGR